MRRPFVTNFALAAALAPALCFAQRRAACAAAARRQPAPASRPPGQQPAAAAGAAAPRGAAPKLAFTTPPACCWSRLSLIRRRSFEEMMGKLKTGLAADPGRRSSSRPPASRCTSPPNRLAPNALYVVTMDPPCRTPSTSSSRCCRRP